MPSLRSILRYVPVSLLFVLIYLLLNRPEVIFISRIGFTAWYPAIGLVMALLLGVGPWYAMLVCFADVFAGKGIYGQPLLSFSSIVGGVAWAACFGHAG